MAELIVIGFDDPNEADRAPTRKAQPDKVLAEFATFRAG